MKYEIARNSGDLAEILGLDRAEGLEFEIHTALNTKIINTVRRRGLTHAQVAEMAGTSRTRITAVMNRNTVDMSTDMLLRILGSLGIAATLKFRRAA